jgi:hypothetical protein
MLVTVTEEDIRSGCQADGENCPIARAVIRATGIPYAWICGLFIAVYATRNDALAPPHGYKEKSLKHWITPVEAARRIRLYDATGYMRPFTFEL